MITKDIKFTLTPGVAALFNRLCIRFCITTERLLYLCVWFAITNKDFIPYVENHRTEEKRVKTPRSLPEQLSFDLSKPEPDEERED